ncbi:MAG TPA: GAF domain-containing protein, partial [Spirochaetes bacterium]|nr:GAF domain-containing protein [Spirochaetota bacterium]
MKAEIIPEKKHTDKLKELQVRVDELETLNAGQKKREEKLLKQAGYLGLINRLTVTFLTVHGDKMYGKALEAVLKAMKSKYGMFGYIDESGALVCPSMTKDVWDRCRLPGKTIVFPRENWGGIWGRAMAEKRTICSNTPFHVPEGHVSIHRAIGVPIIYQSEVIGLLLVGNKEADYDKDDRELLEMAADHIALTLYPRLQSESQEKKRKQAEEIRRGLVRDLGERVKELNCLYGISNLVEKQGVPLKEILQGTVDLVPASWQYPGITCARIVLENKDFKTSNFNETSWKQSADIIMHDEKAGAIEVFYLDEKPEIFEGPFLKEERDLINAVAERLGRVVERKQVEVLLEKSQEELIINEKLAALGQFSASVAHELKNPLGVIDSSVYFLKKKLKGSDEKTAEHLDRIKSKVKSSTEVIESLLNLTQMKQPRLENFNLKALVPEVLSSMSMPGPVSENDISTLSAGATRIFTEIDPSPPIASI